MLLQEQLQLLSCSVSCRHCVLSKFAPGMLLQDHHIIIVLPPTEPPAKKFMSTLPLILPLAQNYFTYYATHIVLYQFFDVF